MKRTLRSEFRAAASIDLPMALQRAIVVRRGDGELFTITLRPRNIFPPSQAPADKRVWFSAGFIKIGSHFAPRIDVGKGFIRRMSYEGFHKRVC